MTSSGNVGAANGNQVVAPVQAPINICGIAAAVGGTATAGCEGGASANFSGLSGDMTSKDNVGLGNGNQAYTPIQTPTDISGNAGTLLGMADAWSTGGSSAAIEEAGGGGTNMTSKRNVGLLNGTQLFAPVQAPVNVCGNAVAAGGIAGAECVGGASATLEGGDTNMTSTENVGIGNGNQVYAPIQAPVNICGNAVAVLGTATASCEGGASAEHGSGSESHKNAGYTESSAAEASTTESATELVEEQLPAIGAPSLDSVTGTAGAVTDGLPVGDLPVVGGLTNGLL
ncbi:hypothetical protein GCM10027447_04860 [Glycomyces halotolerans]